MSDEKVDEILHKNSGTCKKNGCDFLKTETEGGVKVAAPPISVVE